MMTRDKLLRHPAADTLRIAKTPSQEHVKDGETDPVRNPDQYARELLHHAIEHGDVLGEDPDGNIMIGFLLSPAEFDRLATFDADGELDVEP